MKSLQGSQHTAIDDFVDLIRSRNALSPKTFYSQGFGNVRGVVELVRDLRDVSSSLRSPHAKNTGMLDLTFPQSLELHATPHGRDFAHVASGTFAAPSYHDILPEPSKKVYFQLITPTAWLSAEGRTASARPMVILLPGTGEHGFLRRRHLLGYPLAAKGVGTLILEGPFYGARKAPGQWGSKINTLSDLPLLGRATIDEARILLGWLRGRTLEEVRATVRSLPRGNGLPGVRTTPPYTPPVSTPRAQGGGAHRGFVLAGISMGGLHAAMTASLAPMDWSDVGWASWLGPPSGVAVFTRGNLARSCDWRAFTRDVSSNTAACAGLPLATLSQQQQQSQFATPAARDTTPTFAPFNLDMALGDLEKILPEGVPHSKLPVAADARSLASAWPGLEEGSLLPALTQVARLLRVTDITNFAPPARADLGVFVRAVHDKYVPYDNDTTELWDFIQNTWHGVEIRGLTAGHVTGSIFHSDAYVRCIEGVAAKAGAA